MTLVNETDPRADQKARTREAIIAAASDLLAEGTTPTVEKAAERARVSRATAYRYFTTKDALHLELAEIAPSLAPVEAELRALGTDDVEQRLLKLLDTFGPIVLAKRRMRWALSVSRVTVPRA